MYLNPTHFEDVDNFFISFWFTLFLLYGNDFFDEPKITTMEIFYKNFES